MCCFVRICPSRFARRLGVLESTSRCIITGTFKSDDLSSIRPAKSRRLLSLISL